MAMTIGMQIPSYLRVLTAQPSADAVLSTELYLISAACFLYFGWADNAIQMTDENSRISQNFHFLTQV